MRTFTDWIASADEGHLPSMVSMATPDDMGVAGDYILDHPEQLPELERLVQEEMVKALRPILEYQIPQDTNLNLGWKIPFVAKTVLGNIEKGMTEGRKSILEELKYGTELGRDGLKIFLPIWRFFLSFTMICQRLEQVGVRVAKNKMRPWIL